MKTDVVTELNDVGCEGHLAKVIHVTRIYLGSRVEIVRNVIKFTGLKLIQVVCAVLYNVFNLH